MGWRASIAKIRTACAICKNRSWYFFKTPSLLPRLNAAGKPASGRPKTSAFPAEMYAAPIKSRRKHMSQVQEKPGIRSENCQAVTPHLVCAGAADAIDFYKKAFGAVETMRLAGPNGKLMHGSIKIGNASIMLVD